MKLNLFVSPECGVAITTGRHVVTVDYGSNFGVELTEMGEGKPISIRINPPHISDPYFHGICMVQEGGREINIEPDIYNAEILVITRIRREETGPEYEDYLASDGATWKPRPRQGPLPEDALRIKLGC